MQPEKRQQVRKPLQTLVELTTRGLSPSSAMSTDVSKGGISILVADSVLEKGTLCEVKFDLLVKGKVLGVKAFAEVAHRARSEYQGYRSGCRIGLKFTAIETLALWTVEAFIGDTSKEIPPIIWTAPHLKVM